MSSGIQAALKARELAEKLRLGLTSTKEIHKFDTILNNPEVIRPENGKENIIYIVLQSDILNDGEFVEIQRSPLGVTFLTNGGLVDNDYRCNTWLKELYA